MVPKLPKKSQYNVDLSTRSLMIVNQKNSKGVFVNY